MMARRYRIIIGLLCIAGLVLVYLLQRFPLAQELNLGDSKNHYFIINRSVRFLLNDFLAIGLVFSLFPERKYVLFAIAIQLTGVILFLIPYFLIKLQFPYYNGPLISFLHRLVINPTLVLLLIPAFYYQRNRRSV